MSQVNLQCVLSGAANLKLKQRASAAEIKELLNSNKLMLSVDVELSFEEVLANLSMTLKSVLLLIHAAPSKSVGVDHKSWAQARQTLQGFTYEHSRSGRTKSVTDEESYTEMLNELSREAAKDLTTIRCPVVFACPIGL